MLKVTRNVTALAGLVLAAGTAHAAPFLNIDIDDVKTGPTVISPTEGGTGEASAGDSPVFYSFPVSDTSANRTTLSFAVSDPSVTAASVSVTLANGTTTDANGDLNGTGTFLSRDRAAPADHETGTNAGFTFGELYRDFATIATQGIEFAGLNANTAYSVTFYSYDNSGSRTETFTNLTGGGNSAFGTITYTANTAFTTSTPNSIYALTATATTDSSGRLIFSGTGGGTSIVNGFQLAAVPEPASLGLMAMGGLTLLRRRVRR